MPSFAQMTSEFVTVSPTIRASLPLLPICQSPNPADIRGANGCVLAQQRHRAEKGQRLTQLLERSEHPVCLILIQPELVTARHLRPRDRVTRRPSFPANLASIAASLSRR
jgi:hypothetical protein